MLRRAVLHLLGQIRDRHRLRVVHDHPRHALHIRRRDSLQLLQPAIRRARILVEHHRPRQFGRAPVRRLARIQHSRHQLVARLVQLRLGHQRIAQPRHFGIQRGQPIRRRLAVGQDHIERIDARIRRDIDQRSRIRSNLLLIDQRLVKPRRLPRCQDRIQHHQRRIVVAVRRRRWPCNAHSGQGRVRLIHRIAPRRRALGLHRSHPRNLPLRRLDPREVFFDIRIQLRLIEIPGHHHHRIVGPVVSRMKRAHVLNGRRVQILDRPDPRPSIRMHVIRRLVQIEIEQLAIRRAQHALAQLLLHHLALGCERRLVDDERPHPLRLAPQHALKVIGRNSLVVVREIVPRRSVVEPARVFRQTIKSFGRIIRRRLEHQVLEQVRKA